jgi:lysophospholipase L1-like esterase
MTAGGPSFTDQTIREVVHSSIGGDRLRLHLTNWQSPEVLQVGEVDLAVQSSGGIPVPGSHHRVTFSGAATTTIPAGRDTTSDIIPMHITAGENLLVSLYLPGTTGSSSWHSYAADTTYISTTGDHANDDDAADYPTKTSAWYYVAGLDVAAPSTHGTVVTFGDSITDGYRSSFGVNHRWPDYLGDRLRGRWGIVDSGISGNRVLTDSPYPPLGISAERRFAHDALDVPGVRDVILLEGINDIGYLVGPNGATLTAHDLINGYKKLIAQAHAAHVRIIGGTILSYKGSYFYSSTGESTRQAVNRWIRRPGHFDGVVDFDAAVCDSTVNIQPMHAR